MFVNISNHPSEKWGAAQRSAALCYGEIVDIPFPNVDPKATTFDINMLVEQYVNKIRALNAPVVVMVQGEFTFTYRLVYCLKAYNITVVSACSERKTVETVDANGVTTKRSEFVFVQFREY